MTNRDAAPAYHSTEAEAEAEAVAAPPCPRCGEHQRRDEARPSRPRVVKDINGRRRTEYTDECRRCGLPMTFGFCFGTGTLGEMLRRAPIVYHWSERDPPA